MTLQFIKMNHHTKFVGNDPAFKEMSFHPENPDTWTDKQIPGQLHKLNSIITKSTLHPPSPRPGPSSLGEGHGLVLKNGVEERQEKTSSINESSFLPTAVFVFYTRTHTKDERAQNERKRERAHLHTHTHTQTHTHTHTDTHTHTHTHTHVARHKETDSYTYRQTDRQKIRQTERQTDRQTEVHTTGKEEDTFWRIF